MVQIYLGIGSNFEREYNIRAALQALLLRLGTLVVSPVFETDPHGRTAPRYWNLVVGAQTDLPVAELKRLLCQIEADGGRVRESGDSGLCALDIDLLLYGDQSGDVEGVTLPHRDLEQLRAYVLYPLSLLAPEGVHPVLQCSYAELWQARKRDGLTPVDFHWQQDVG